MHDRGAQVTKLGPYAPQPVKAMSQDFHSCVHLHPPLAPSSTAAAAEDEKQALQTYLTTAEPRSSFGTVL